MIVGALIQAGLSGVRRALPLPATLSEALKALESDPIASAWMPEPMRRSYLDLKRLEQELAESQSPEELCRRHAESY